MPNVFSVVTGGIFAATTPDSWEDVQLIVGSGNFLTELDSMVIAPARAPIGYITFFDVVTPAPGQAVTFWIPVVQKLQIVSFADMLGAPLPPFGTPRTFLTYGWSLTPDTFTPILTKLPTADLDITFGVRVDTP